MLVFFPLAGLTALFPQYILIAPPPTSLTSPSFAFARQSPSLLLRHLHPSHLTLGISLHERSQSPQRRPDAPCRLPRLFVVSADTKTNLAIDFESTRGRQEAEGRWAQWVGRRQYYAAMVCALAVGSGRRTLKGEVPFEEIRFERSRVQSWVWMAREFSCFFENALYGGGFGVEGWEGHGYEKCPKPWVVVE